MSQQTLADPSAVLAGADTSNVNDALPVPSGSVVALPLRSATKVRVTGARPLLVRALPKAMVGTAIAAASPTAVKAKSLLFSIGSLSLDAENSHSGLSGAVSTQ